MTCARRRQYGSRKESGKDRKKAKRKGIDKEGGRSSSILSFLEENGVMIILLRLFLLLPCLGACQSRCFRSILIRSPPVRFVLRCRLLRLCCQSGEPWPIRRLSVPTRERARELSSCLRTKNISLHEGVVPRATNRGFKNGKWRVVVNSVVELLLQRLETDCRS
jgi:hypothetical protein